MPWIPVITSPFTLDLLTYNIHFIPKFGATSAYKKKSLVEGNSAYFFGQNAEKKV